MRSERNYWRSRAQYDRNRYWGSRNVYGWGYGYYPGLTYHRGWGYYGYGYIRGGLNIVDAMIIYSIFGHTRTSNNTTVINNYQPPAQGTGDDANVMAVPQGTTIIGFAPDQKLRIPDGQGGFEEAAIPVGSTIQTASNGTLIQTPDGQAVLVPSSADAYKAEDGYQVPQSAQAAQEYAEFQSADSGGTSAWMYIMFGVIALGLAGGAYFVVQSRKTTIG